MAEDAEAVAPTDRIRRIPEGGGCRRGERGGRGRKGGRGRGIGIGEGDRGCKEGGDRGPSQQPQGGASTSHEHEVGMSTQAEIPATPTESTGHR
ncbi:hypothetical protein PIB30_098956, partial [Stylosanthes scabra]|nr:hypothetical protein [Stylosanthes scabra]